MPLFSYAGGIAHRGHGVPVTGSTRFTVASVTKMVTAATALRLVERGEVRLDQPLTEVLPAEHQTSALTGAHTLHHLLSHTSGLPNYHDDEAVTWDSFLSCWDRIPCQRARVRLTCCRCSATCRRWRGRVSDLRTPTPTTSWLVW